MFRESKLLNKNVDINQMLHNDFDIEIIAPSAHPLLHREGRYVSLTNGSEYALRLSNPGPTPCDISVYIDKKRVGQWRISPRDYIVIERPADISRKFTFFSEYSVEALSTGAVPGREGNGLIQVIFKPGKDTLRASFRGEITSVESARFNTSSSSSSSSSRSAAARFGTESTRYGSGVTVLGDTSSQRFFEVNKLQELEIDWNRTQEIDLRLVVDKAQSKYLPLTPRID